MATLGEAAEQRSYIRLLAEDLNEAAYFNSTIDEYDLLAALEKHNLILIPYDGRRLS